MSGRIYTVHPKMVSSNYQFFQETKIYYSSTWTGRISTEEQSDIIMKKLISDRVKKRMQKYLEDLIMFGSTHIRFL